MTSEAMKSDSCSPAQWCLYGHGLKQFVQLGLRASPNLPTYTNQTYRYCYALIATARMYVPVRTVVYKLAVGGECVGFNVPLDT